jgi:hypothetical protein
MFVQRKSLTMLHDIRVLLNLPVRKPRRRVDWSGEVPVVAVRRRGRLLILQCPHCGKRHVHGDGGRRGPRCTDIASRTAAIRMPPAPAISSSNAPSRASTNAERSRKRQLATLMPDADH